MLDRLQNGGGERRARAVERLVGQTLGGRLEGQRVVGQANSWRRSCHRAFLTAPPRSMGAGPQFAPGAQPLRERSRAGTTYQGRHSQPYSGTSTSRERLRARLDGSRQSGLISIAFVGPFFGP